MITCKYQNTDAYYGNHRRFSGIHKHYTVEEWQAFAKKHPTVLPFVAASAGSSDSDSQKLADIMAVVDVPFICLDVANGYSEHVRLSLTDRTLFTLLVVFAVVCGARKAC
jgi:hypothetical protein